MVQASTELLGGAAVTVFLALLFFGVVVLWDVALALRSVGDKIDKLEDNIDDDLTDIAHSLDGMSNAPGGSGGTQLHLSGGTISSGPGAAGPQQAQQTQQAAAGAQGVAAGEQHPGGPHPDSGQQRPEQRAEAARREPDGDEAGSADDEPAATPDPDESGDANEADTATPDDEEPAPDEPERPADETAMADEPTDNDVDAAEPHPHAERNRGRFITSPDRTAWYATPLDRAAIDAAQPSIAGALPDGSEPEIDASEVIAAGPGDADESVDTASDGGATATGSGTAPDADGEPVASTDDREAEADSGMKRAAETASDAGDGASADERTAAESDDGTDVDHDAEIEAIDESDPGPSEPDAESVDANVDASDADAVPDSPEDIDVLSFEDSDEPADGLDVDADTVTDLERPTDDGDDAVTKPETADADAELPDSGPEPSDGEAESAGLAEFEFDAEEFEADDVTVEEAVDTMNEDAPAPELSSHRFDVTAEETDGSAVVTLEFGADTVDITGSTKRLLQYQMQSFADRESTPEGEVTIDRDRIVIEIPDSDGAAVTQWGEAAVSIVDRTLYLSDNSS